MHIPSDITVECDKVSSPPGIGVLDNCDTAPAVISSSLRSDGNCSDSYAIVTTWIATDHSGNTANAFHTATIQDFVAPIISEVPTMLEISVSCGNIPDAPKGVVTDNCDHARPIEYSQSTLSETETDQYRLIRTWKAQDNCGNIAQTVQTIHVLKDTESPIFTNVPHNEHAICDNIIDAIAPSVKDNCDTSILPDPVKEKIIDGSCPNEWVLIRTWSASDSSGNVATAHQTIDVIDNIPPSLNVPEKNVVSCHEVPEPKGAFATDKCDQVATLEFEEDRTDSVESLDRYTLIRTWTATDACGNSVSKSQRIEVDDATKPEFVNLPDPLEISCEDANSSFPEVRATDNCDDEVSITNTHVITDYTCFFTHKLIHSWVATDRSGNSRTAAHTISIYDTTPPVLSEGEPDTTVACHEVPSPAILNATDNCQDHISVQMSEDSYFEFPNFINVRYWETMDNCGNEAEYVQTVTISDTAAPVLSGVPHDITLECGSTIPFFYVRANDVCDDKVNVTMEKEPTTGSCPDMSIVVYTWSATDVSGNTGTAVATIVIEDTTPPTLDAIPSLSRVTYECDDIPKPDLVSTTDNCHHDVTVIFSESNTQTDSNDIEYEITRSWTATDRCGNHVDTIQVIVVQDTKAPILTCQHCEELFVGCDHIPTAAKMTGEDNCDSSVIITFDETREDGSCDAMYVLTRSWVSVDSSGNNASFSQIIHVVDNVVPVLIGVPSDEMRECNNLPEDPNVTATDNCDDTISVEMSESVIDQISDHQYKKVRVWTATDSCGQINVGIQTTEIVDTNPPTFSKNPSSVSVEIDQVKETWPGKITAIDNCDQVITVDFTQNRIDGSCHYTYVLVRTWRSVDSSGNIAVQHQTVGLNDYTPPHLTGIPDDTIVEYEQRRKIPSLISVLEKVTASDNSGSAIDITDTEKKISMDCGSTYLLLRTFSAEDDCGNVVVVTQTIKIVDNTAPTINKPEDETVECDAISQKCKVAILANPDHPDYGLKISFSENKIEESTPNQYKLVRNWWVDDCAGNQAFHSQTVTVQDKTPPVFSRLPSDQINECTCEDSHGVDVEALDNCDIGAVVVDMVEIKENDEKTSPDNFTMYRRWTASDSSGNEVSYTQTITISDSSAPELCEENEPPSNAFVQCDAVPPPPDLKFKDNCDPSVNVQFSETKIDGNCKNDYSLIRTWIASDRTGNSKVHEQTIQVSDDGEPALLTDSMLCLFPANGRIAVYEQASTRLIEAIDNCGAPTVNLQSCNSSQPESNQPPLFPSDCAYNSDADTLYIRIERNDQVTEGRTYRLWAMIEDACGNQKLTKKSIWIPYDQSSFDAEDRCSGTGADHFVYSLPDF